MFLHAASEERPYLRGPFPMEVLPRDRAVNAREAAKPPGAPSSEGPIAWAIGRYHAMFAGLADGADAPWHAPPPDELASLCHRVARAKDADSRLEAASQPCVSMGTAPDQAAAIVGARGPG